MGTLFCLRMLWVHLLKVITLCMMTSSNGKKISTLLALCSGISSVTSEFPSQRPMMQSFDVFFDLGLNKWLSKHPGAGDLRCHCAHYDITVMVLSVMTCIPSCSGWCHFCPCMGHGLIVGRPGHSSSCGLWCELKEVNNDYAIPVWFS